MPSAFGVIIVQADVWVSQAKRPGAVPEPDRVAARGGPPPAGIRPWHTPDLADSRYCLRKLFRRGIKLLHLKDLDPAREQSTVPVGDGILDWAAILAAADAAKVRWYSVEQDHSADPMGGVARSLHYLNGHVRNA